MSKLKGTGNLDHLPNGDRRPMLTAITKPRFASSSRHEDSTANATETKGDPAQLMKNL